MDIGVVASILGTLGGVVLGSWLSTRMQVRLQRQSRRYAVADAKRDVYAEYLSTLRQFRRFIVRLPPDRISLAEGSGSPRGAIPLIDNSDHYWNALERARSRLWITVGYDSCVREAADQVNAAIYKVATEQAKHPAGTVPARVIDESRNAEQNFTRTAYQDYRSELGPIRIGSKNHGSPGVEKFSEFS